MGLFGAARAAVGRIFGGRKAEVVKPHFRGEEAATLYVAGQMARRKKLLERRVAEDLSAEVYDNKKLTGALIAPAYPGETAYTASPYIDDFLLGFAFSAFASSNVAQLVYDPKTRSLHVQYLRKNHAGRWYKYGQIGKEEAMVAYNTASKGVFSWSHLRDRKPTTRDEPPPSYLPLGRKKSNILQSP